MITAVGEELSTPLAFSFISELAHFCIEYMYELHDFYWEVWEYLSMGVWEYLSMGVWSMRVSEYESI